MEGHDAALRLISRFVMPSRCRQLADLFPFFAGCPMHDTWLKLVGRVLRPTRSRLEFLERERERHVEEQRALGERRTRAVGRCCARIEAARAEIFAADDGVVSWKMLELEREWRRLSRNDVDGALMNLWARLVPSRWHDHKRFRDSAPDRRLDAVIALASDVDGIDAAVTAIDALRPTLVPFGVTVRQRLRFRLAEEDFAGTRELFAGSRAAALTALETIALDDRSYSNAAVAQAEELSVAVREAASARFPTRGLLVESLASAAGLDVLWRAARLSSEHNPVTPLRALWATGYVLSVLDATGLTLELPAIRPR